MIFIEHVVKNIDHDLQILTSELAWEVDSLIAFNGTGERPEMVNGVGHTAICFGFSHMPRSHWTSIRTSRGRKLRDTMVNLSANWTRLAGMVLETANLLLDPATPATYQEH
ncbi:MAG: hypothetical protein EOP89_03565 [Lysobacteraceae bacterium]|nr:MAG: hypothetical protein EOP89_03565 [Xanthomonadaceae bacterium]